MPRKQNYNLLVQPAICKWGERIYAKRTACIKMSSAPMRRICIFLQMVLTFVLWLYLYACIIICILYTSILVCTSMYTSNIYRVDCNFSGGVQFMNKISPKADIVFSDIFIIITSCFVLMFRSYLFKYNFLLINMALWHWCCDCQCHSGRREHSRSHISHH